MPKKGTKSRNNTPVPVGCGVSTRRRRGGKDIVSVKQEEDQCGGGGGGVSTRSSLRLLRIRIRSPQEEALGANAGVFHIGNAQPEILGVSTPDVQSSQPQPDDGNARSVLSRKITRCVNSVMSSKQLSTTEGKHAPCLNQSDPVPLHENHNKKGKPIAGKGTPKDQPSPLGCLGDSMEEEPTTLVPSGSNLLSKNSSSLLLRTQTQVVQDRGLILSNDDCSSLIPPTGNERSKRLLEKFRKMRKILEKDSNTFQLLETLIQHDSQDADVEVRVKPEPICLDLEDEVIYIVGKDYEHTLRKIISSHGDIAKGSFYTSLVIRTDFLETVCKIYKKLEGSNIFEIDVSEMSSILQTLDQLEHAKMEVKWLIDRVTQRIELTEELSRLLTFRNIANKKASKIEQRVAMLEVYKSQLEFHEARSKSLKEMIKEEGEELASEKRVSEVFNLFSDSWVNKVKPLGQPLAHGLL